MEQQSGLMPGLSILHWFWLCFVFFSLNVDFCHRDHSISSECSIVRQKCSLMHMRVHVQCMLWTALWILLSGNEDWRRVPSKGNIGMHWRTGIASVGKSVVLLSFCHSYCHAAWSMPSVVNFQLDIKMKEKIRRLKLDDQFNLHHYEIIVLT